VANASTTVFTANMREAVHRWYRFSAGFSSAWAAEVITQSGATRVLDPFAGSGTTLLAAQDAGVQSLGVENQPFIARLARAKLAWNADVDAFRSGARAVRDQAAPRTARAEPALLAKVFDAETLCDLRALQAATPLADDLLWLALVAILRPCARAGTAPWQYVLPNKTKAKVGAPFAAYEAQVAMMAADMELRGALGEPVAARILEEDARQCASVPDRWATLVLTSPPYANNYDYADATRLEMTFLGEIAAWSDLKWIRERLVHACSQHMAGADAFADLESPRLEPLRPELDAVVAALAAEREHHGGKKAYHAMIVAYFTDLAAVWQALRRACAPGARVCFVVGDSAPYGVHVPVERWLGDLAVANGFRSYRFEKTRDRNVKWQNRKHRTPLHEGLLWVEG
jgi:hypothetical protein